MQNIHQEGIFISRSYQHISKCEKEILELKSQGLTRKEIEVKFGFTKGQVHNLRQYRCGGNTKRI